VKGRRGRRRKQLLDGRCVSV